MVLSLVCRLQAAAARTARVYGLGWCTGAPHLSRGFCTPTMSPPLLLLLRVTDRLWSELRTTCLVLKDVLRLYLFAVYTAAFLFALSTAFTFLFGWDPVSLLLGHIRPDRDTFFLYLLLLVKISYFLYSFKLADVIAGFLMGFSLSSWFSAVCGAFFRRLCGRGSACDKLLPMSVVRALLRAHTPASTCFCTRTG